MSAPVWAKEDQPIPAFRFRMRVAVTESGFEILTPWPDGDAEYPAITPATAERTAAEA